MELVPEGFPAKLTNDPFNPNSHQKGANRDDDKLNVAYRIGGAAWGTQ